MQEYLRKCN